MSEPRLPFAGRVKTWKHERGFGFVRGDDGRDIFVQQSVLRVARLSSLEAGQRVRFDLGPGPDGRVRCTKIAIVEGACIKAAREISM